MAREKTMKKSPVRRKVSMQKVNPFKTPNAKMKRKKKTPDMKQKNKLNRFKQVNPRLEKAKNLRKGQIPLELNNIPLHSKKDHKERGQEQLCNMPSENNLKLSERNTNFKVTSKKAKLPNPPQPVADAIVIDDSDEENACSNTNDGAQPHELFYLDRKPGVHQGEIPLYNVVFDQNNPTHKSEAFEESTIVLDSSIDQSVNACEEIMTINIESVPTSPSTQNQAGKSASSDDMATASSLNKATTPSSIELVSEVIDLSDDSDDQPTSSSRPVLPNVCIPLGYDIVMPRTTKYSCRKQSPTAKNETKSKVKPSSIPAPESPKKRMVVIDGNNVATIEQPDSRKVFSAKRLEICLNYFKTLGHEVVAVVPQYRLNRSQSTDQMLLQKLYRQEEITLAPSKKLPGQFSNAYDDRLILAIAEKFDGVIVSNDYFRDLLDASPAWRHLILNRVLTFSWCRNEFFLTPDPYGQDRPSNDQILNGYSA